MNTYMNKQEIIFKLMEIGALKFGSFALKSGIISPIYIDLRLVISYPELLKSIAKILWDKIYSLSFDLVCGVPYTALPIATAISLYYNIPMIMRRKESKDYGTKKNIEGAFQKGQRCLIIEDLITSGMSIFETITPLEKEGLIINDVIVLIDREQGGKRKVMEEGYNLTSAFTLSELMETLKEANKLDAPLVSTINTFIEENQVL